MRIPTLLTSLFTLYVALAGVSGNVQNSAEPLQHKASCNVPKDEIEVYADSLSSESSSSAIIVVATSIQPSHADVDFFNLQLAVQGAHSRRMYAQISNKKISQAAGLESSRQVTTSVSSPKAKAKRLSNLAGRNFTEDMEKTRRCFSSHAWALTPTKLWHYFTYRGALTQWREAELCTYSNAKQENGQSKHRSKRGLRSELFVQSLILRGYDPRCQHANCVYRFFLCGSVNHHARQIHNLGDPAPVVLDFCFHLVDDV